jgi:hypothetical protein
MVCLWRITGVNDEGDEESVVVEAAMGNLQSLLRTLGETPTPRAPAPESEMSLTGLCGCPSVRGQGLCPRVPKRVRLDGTWLAVTSFGADSRHALRPCDDLLLVFFAVTCRLLFVFILRHDAQP